MNYNNGCGKSSEGKCFMNCGKGCDNYMKGGCFMSFADDHDLGKKREENNYHIDVYVNKGLKKEIIIRAHGKKKTVNELVNDLLRREMGYSKKEWGYECQVYSDSDWLGEMLDL